MSSGIQGVRRWDVLDGHGRRASILIGHTGEGDVAIGIATDGGDARFVLLDPRTQTQLDNELHSAIRRAWQELL